MSIGQWLQGLGLERYTAVFEEQEIDLTVVHAISAEELAGLGVTDRLHQARILQAADAVATTLGLRRLRGTISGRDSKPAAAKKQRQLTLHPGNSTAPAAGSAPVQQQQQGATPPPPQQQHLQQAPPQFQQERQGPVDAAMREAAPRPQERALLASLYPAAAGAAGGGEASSGQQPQQRTPQLAGGRTLARAAPAAASLWAGAGSCMPVAPTLAARLAQREAADPEAVAARKQPLARGGTAYPVGEETRALKRVKLEALRQELATHEATVAELRRMIAGLERELGD